MKPTTMSREAEFNAALAAAVRESAVQSFTGNYTPGRITEANAALFNDSYYTESLTGYAVGYRDESGLADALDFFAPAVRVGRKFEYLELSNADAFESDTDDERAAFEDFKSVKMSKQMVLGKTVNRGLQITVDLDEEGDDTDWETRKVGQLIDRLNRNALIRAIALLNAAAVNVNLTWDASAGKDPDMDILQMISDGADDSGMAGNRVGYGESAWMKRVLSHRAQDSAGGIASAGLSPEQVAMFLNVDSVKVNRSRVMAGLGLKEQILANKVFSFTAAAGMSREDASNIKRFYTPIAGGMYRVFKYQSGPKLWTIAVECYEQSKITSTLGIRKATIS